MPEPAPVTTAVRVASAIGRISPEHRESGDPRPLAIQQRSLNHGRVPGRDRHDGVLHGTHGFAGTEFFTRKVADAQTSFDRLLAFAQKRLR
jgi:hypothetical protein